MREIMYVTASDLVRVQREEPNQEIFDKQIKFGSLVTPKTDLNTLPDVDESEVMSAARFEGFAADDWGDFNASRGLPRDADIYSAFQKF